MQPGHDEQRHDDDRHQREGECEQRRFQRTFLLAGVDAGLYGLEEGGRWLRSDEDTRSSGRHPIRSYLILGAQLLLSCVLLFAAFVTFAFAGESNRGRPVPASAETLHLAALLVAVSPFLLSAGLLIVRWWLGDCIPPWAQLTPLLLGVVAAPLFVRLIGAAETETGRARREEQRAALEEVRASARSGSDARVCELLNLDPEAGAEEARRCFTHLERLAGPERWRELGHFHDQGHFNVRGPSRAEPTVPALHQRRFLELFFETWMARPDFLGSREDRLLCWFGLHDLLVAQDWSEEARALLRSTLLPRLRERLAGPAAPAVPRDCEDLSNAELLERLDALAS
jgi:hypothetical protein